MAGRTVHVSIMNICTVHGDAHHWDEERAEDGIIHQRCACGETRAFSEEPETIAEEEARLVALLQAQEKLIASRIAELEDEGIGDGLNGALAVLLHPTLVPPECRSSEITAHVLRIIAQRDIARQASVGADLTRIDRVEIIDRTGRSFSRRYEVAGASMVVQDDGRTLKLFVDGRSL